MKKLVLLILTFTLLVSNVNQSTAQQNCGTTEYYKKQIIDNPSQKDYLDDLETKLQNWVKHESHESRNTTLTIPIVVHVVHKNNDENISDNQIFAQIEQLNIDFRRLNSDQDGTWSQAADTEIEFCLAKSDPSCLPTSGITRTSTSTEVFTDVGNEVKSAETGGVNPWPTDKYLNIWVCNIQGFNGYAQFPGGDPLTDGVVVDYSVFGVLDQVNSNIKRTTTHEVGHYLNLRHLHGDPGNGVDGCTVDDFVSDTPNASDNYTFFNSNVVNATCGSTDMVENFMTNAGYSRNLFTEGQKIRAISTLNIARASLLESTVCEQTPTCNPVINVQIMNLEDNSATLTWDIDGASWSQYRYREVGTTLWTVNSISGNSIDIQNLIPMTDYEFEVRSYCNSCYINLNFTTPCSNGTPCSPCFTGFDYIINAVNGTVSLVLTEYAGNIIVRDGANLLINQDIQFSEDSQLIIEPGGRVVIDGATLSKCPVATSWKGVQLQSDMPFNIFLGDPTPGEIELKNGAVIRDAQIGIDAKNSTMYGIYNVDFGGGIIDMNQSYIIDCGTAIQFAPVSFIYNDQSKITSSFIENCQYGIHADGSNGVEIIDTRFINNIQDIQSYGSSFDLDLNHFYAGVWIESESPSLLGSTVKSNHFYAGDLSVSSQGNYTSMNVLNNKFMNGSGSWMTGDVDFMAINNDFLGSYYGNFTWHTGDNQSNNEIRDNYFQNNLYGNVAVGINDVEYLSNCFENSDEADIEVNTNSKIRLIQGDDDSDESAGNCFENSTRIITASNSVEFDYWTKDGLSNTTNCKYPGDESQNNFNLVLATFERLADDCGSNLISPPGTSSNLVGCNCDPTNVECTTEIANLQSDIENLENNSTINFWVKRKELAKLRRCLDRLIKTYVSHLIEIEDREEAISFLSGQSDLRYLGMAYALILETLDYSRARSFINNMSPINQEVSDFIDVQNIHLDYLSDRNNYNLTANDLSDLFIMGKRGNPTSGYARSLYYKLTGSRIDIDYQHVNKSNTPKFRAVSDKEKIEIFPNPTEQDFLNVTIDKIDPLSDYSVNIYNVFGKLIAVQKINTNSTKISIESEKGILIFSILKDGELIDTKKVIRI